MRFRLIPFIVGVILASAAPAGAQMVAVDHAVRAGKLWCFPLANNPKEYLYLPATGKLGTDPMGGPEFSFTRYIESAKAGGEGGISQVGGGGVLHFLALYETSPADLRAAEKALQESVSDEQVHLRGPLVFSSGRYAVVSSLAMVEEGAAGMPKRKALATGNAPVLEGGKIAVSFGLEQRDSEILFQTFKTTTPDVSIVFEMQFSGVVDAYDATLDVNWDEVRKDRYIQAGLKTPWVSGDIESTFQRLTRNNAIKVTSRGDSAPTEAMLNAAYGRLLDMLFHKTDEPPPPPKQETSGSLLDLLSSKLFSFSVTGAYRVNDLKTGGHTTIQLNHQASVTRTALISFNIGDLYRRFGKNPAYFRTVAIDVPEYKQREVHIGLDGSLLADFERYVNTVTVTIRKEHQDGQTTLKEVLVNRDAFTKNPQGFTTAYGWSGDDDRTAWLGYEYRTSWSFKDGGVHEEDWRKSDTPAINLLPPYERREVTLTGDPAALKKAGVRAVVVTLTYDFFGKPRSARPVSLRVGDGPLEEKVELIQTRGDYRYRYEIRWLMADGKQLTKPAATDTSGLILIDEVPGP